MKRNIVIYRDEGVGEFGLQCLEKFFAGDDVWFASAEAVIDGRVLGMADVFVMPGGADLPYCRKLNGAGNDNIRAYVEEGGVYLGICAGAYYGCARVEYHKGRPDEICGPRELAFIDATAVGSLHDLAAPYDDTLASAAIARITLADGGETKAYYHGGCAFSIRDCGNVDIIASYSDLPRTPPAILQAYVGDGLAILSGVHLEVMPENFAHHPCRNEGDKDHIPALRDGIDASAGSLLKNLLEQALS